MIPPPRLTLVPRADDDTETASDASASDTKDHARAEQVPASPAAELQRAVRAKLTEDRKSELATASELASAVAEPITGDEAAPTDAAAPAASHAVATVVEGASDAKVSPARLEALRILEAVLFAASEPLDEKRLEDALGKKRLDDALGADVKRAGEPSPETQAATMGGPKTARDKRAVAAPEQHRGASGIAVLLADLQQAYAPRGVNLVRVAGKWAFRTAQDLSYLLERHASEERKLSKAALETMAIIAYHQPVTRAEIEEIRGVSTSAGTLDILLETGWVRPRGRRRAPGRPVTYGTTDLFLGHFGLDTIKDLPGLSELKGSGLLDNNLPPGFTVPEPCDVAALMPDELPLDTPDEEEAQTEMQLDATDGDEPSPET